MAAIRILSDRVANQIAAGEVVERPASIVKELVENSLDAGATRIEVEFHHGGRSFIRVEDNGCGMSRDDALLCLERHATSKIREATDLDHVRTFGFRGEAMPSIASVSRFILQTRNAASEHGTEVLINGGKVVHVRECGMPVGTRITVSHLFNSVPARRKFLKSDATEAAHLIHHTRLYALASPHVSFTLIEDGRTIFRSPVCSSLGERVAEVFGRQIAADLIPIEATEDGLTLGGLISKPGVARSTRHEMITFVNRRPVDSRTLAYALLESYHTLIPKGRYPIAFVFLDLAPAAVDVNVHPAKREVRFRDESRVRGFTIRTVLDALRGGATEEGGQRTVVGGQRAVDGGRRAEDGGQRAEDRGRRAEDGGRRTEGDSPSLAPAPIALRTAPTDAAAPATRPVSSAVSARALAPAPAPTPARPAPWRHLGGLDGGYSLFEAASGGLIVLDRRAASERVWFERLLGQYRSGRVETQRLLLPLPLELDPVAAATLGDSLPHLRAHGVEIEPFGRDFFRIEGVPAFLAPAEAEVFVRDLLGLLRGGQSGGRGTALSDEELARTAASRAAAAAAAPMPAQALDALVVDLLRCQNPHTSPAGRPTFIEITAGELLRRFHKMPQSLAPDFGPAR